MNSIHCFVKDFATGHRGPKKYPFPHKGNPLQLTARCIVFEQQVFTTKKAPETSRMRAFHTFPRNQFSFHQQPILTEAFSTVYNNVDGAEMIGFD